MLIVDDEVIYARSLAVALKKEFQRRITVGSYQEAVEALNSFRINVALLDVEILSIVVEAQKK